MLLYRNIKQYERGFLFVNGACRALWKPGRRIAFDILNTVRVDVVSIRAARLQHKDLEVIIKSGVLAGEAEVVEVLDNERALVWLDERFAEILPPGKHALWTSFAKVRVEKVSTAGARLVRNDLNLFAGRPELDMRMVPAGSVGLFYVNGELKETLPAGRYALWRGASEYRLEVIDLREKVLDIAGQDVMTADKTSIRVNAVVVYRVIDAAKMTTESTDAMQALYRDAQLALREEAGTRELDALLADKNALAESMRDAVAKKARAYGVQVESLGIRDLILPGDMRELFNKVTEARKAAEAALITRREETASIRSQANTAKIFESNPILMRLRELEALEKVSEKTNLTVILGQENLPDRVTKMI